MNRSLEITPRQFAAQAENLHRAIVDGDQVKILTLLSSMFRHAKGYPVIVQNLSFVLTLAANEEFSEALVYWAYVVESFYLTCDSEGLARPSIYNAPTIPMA